MSLLFSNLIMMCLVFLFFVFFLPRVYWAAWTWDVWFLSNLKTFQPFFLGTFCLLPAPLHSLPLFLGLHFVYVTPLGIAPQVTDAVFFFLVFLYYFCFLTFFVSVLLFGYFLLYLQVRWFFFFFSAVSEVLLRLYGEFLFQVSSTSSKSIQFLFIFCIHLLI